MGGCNYFFFLEKFQIVRWRNRTECRWKTLILGKVLQGLKLHSLLDSDTAAVKTVLKMTLVKNKICHFGFLRPSGGLDCSYFRLLEPELVCSKMEKPQLWGRLCPDLPAGGIIFPQQSKKGDHTAVKLHYLWVFFFCWRKHQRLVPGGELTAGYIWHSNERLGHGVLANVSALVGQIWCKNGEK